ncbi:MAG: hypothetical protein R3181_08620 [Rubricoccaceae bacterium]|nr:hypothetical protein [Rubricoccaceae bacterium]
MLSFVVLQVVLLFAAAGLLAVEARAGRLDGSEAGGGVVRALVYLLAAIAGGTLLITLADSEWLFALGLVPVTMLALVRFTMMARRWWVGWQLPVYTGVLLAFGVLLSVPWMPTPLDRTTVLREIHGIEAIQGPDTIDPEAHRPVRA